tara:strand:- start:749 stop:2341 length:1593 start_codon:yes stop_codon:yes gene_type:complete
MAIVQVSRITNRKGLSENLPQLAGAEFGWVIDQRKLYIGNGTIADGAPAIGNTEVLTEYSDILSLGTSYTYKGQHAGYTVQTGPTSGDAVTQTLQAKLDNFASVLDFGATGDGVTDDTDAINRALFQLFCVQTNTTIRRSLYFPGGTYRITNSINVPPFAKLYGDGPDSAILEMDVSSDSSYGAYVIRTADSLQQTGVNIGSNSATPPRDIVITGMSFTSKEPIDLVLIDRAEGVSISNCNFKGSLSSAPANASDNIAGLRFDSTASNTCKQIEINNCKFSLMTYALNTDENIQGVTVQNSQFTDMYQGILLGTGTPDNGGPEGVRIVQNLFDEVAKQAISIGAVAFNASAYNIFLDCGNDYLGAGNAAAAVIEFNGDNNVSVGDMFERSDADDRSQPRVQNNDKACYALTNGDEIEIGTYHRLAGVNSALTVQGSATTIFTVNTLNATAFNVIYQYKEPTTNVIRFGELRVVGQDTDDSAGTLAYVDDFSEDNPNSFVLSAVQSGSTISVQYTSTIAATFKYSIEHLSV